ncbi:LapA family protein [Mastigocoleus sp. MO_188.B34]|uniref:LapA family protein n=1 Tax=Mastigocoleus sp. MO_188.B34 TaxID=3036635 RepID=UPI002617E03D|nr:LapA family protein [Mastigocoleus sp. MO_188.B34]MDJ0694151.1 LapA family protein [Mastigocoleus sp. MO_188.B34]
MFPVRQLNFVIIFILGLGLVLFAIQNSEPATIQILPNLEVKAPVVVEFLLAVGLGAILAWLFSVWTQLQQNLISSQKVRQKNMEIRELKSKIENYQEEVQSLKLALPPAAEMQTKDLQEANAD